MKNIIYYAFRTEYDSWFTFWNLLDICHNKCSAFIIRGEESQCSLASIIWLYGTPHSKSVYRAIDHICDVWVWWKMFNFTVGLCLGPGHGRSRKIGFVCERNEGYIRNSDRNFVAEGYGSENYFWCPSISIFFVLLKLTTTIWRGNAWR